jgi:hypothetical protein
MWFLYNKVLLTKDNLAKQGWEGCKECAFCDTDKTIDHLFIHCNFAKLMWQVVHFTFNIPSPTNITNMFGSWLNGMDNKTKSCIRIGVCALVWAIWNCRNDIIFNRATRVQFLQAINKTTYWINMTGDGCSGYLQPGWLAAF